MSLVNIPVLSVRKVIGKLSIVKLSIVVIFNQYLLFVCFVDSKGDFGPWRLHGCLMPCLYWGYKCAQ